MSAYTEGRAVGAEGEGVGSNFDSDRRKRGRLTLDERLLRAEQELNALKAAKAEIDAAQKKRVSAQEKKNRVRQLILDGTVLAEMVKLGVVTEEQRNDWRNRAIVRPTDRSFFKLDEPTDGAQHAGAGSYANATN